MNERHDFITGSSYVIIGETHGGQWFIMSILSLQRDNQSRWRRMGISRWSRQSPQRIFQTLVPKWNNKNYEMYKKEKKIDAKYFGHWFLNNPCSFTYLFHALEYLSGKSFGHWYFNNSCCLHNNNIHPFNFYLLLARFIIIQPERLIIWL